MMRCMLDVWKFLIFGALISSLKLIAAPVSGVPSKRYQMLSGVSSESQSIRSTWDKMYSSPTYVFGKAPAKFLADNYDYLAPVSTVLDLGMGEGRNAVYLAQKGYQVTGIDI